MATSVYGEKGALAHNPPIASTLTYRITKLDGNEILNRTTESIMNFRDKMGKKYFNNKTGDLQ